MRNYSSTNSFSLLQEKEVKGSKYYILSMNKKPVNSLNLEFMQDLTKTLKHLESDPKCEGLILTSALPKIFSAGLDIHEFHNSTPARLGSFWRALQDLWLTLYLSRLCTVAALSGESPAGGCLLAMSCDYRIMASKYKIGLNEVNLGIVAPFWFVDVFVNTIGQRNAEKLLQLGSMVPAKEACSIGLVDEVVETETETLERAVIQLEKFLLVPHKARYLTKLKLRSSTAETLKKQQDNDVQHFIEFITADPIQRGLSQYMELLKSKAAKP